MLNFYGTRIIHGCQWTDLSELTRAQREGEELVILTEIEEGIMNHNVIS